MTGNRFLTGKTLRAIGLMSGTSMDGVDVALLDTDGETISGFGPTGYRGYSEDERALLREALKEGSRLQDRVSRTPLLAKAEDLITRAHAEAVETFLAANGLSRADIGVVGFHGQTVIHRPDLKMTVQIGDGLALRQRLGIPVVYDLRQADIAAGGQGAPLVPPFHAAIFGAPQARAVLNLGGIANVTLLAPGAPVRGFDTGPANVLLDGWCQRHLNQPFDADGRWAASGKVLAPLLEALIAGEPWFALPPPKSTGRDLFNMRWLDDRLAACDGPRPAPEDVQATLQRLTARTVANAIDAGAAGVTEIYVCGGGARNGALMRELAYCLQRPVHPTDALGVPAQQVEALAFAWLAHRFTERRPAGLPDVTGARGPRILGALYPA